MNDYSPQDSLDNALRYWWVIVLLTIWGGLVGWFVHQLRPPIYEARAAFFVSIDFSQTGELTQFEEDHAVSALNRTVYSDAVLDRVVAAAQEEGILLDRADLELKSKLERKQARWTLYVRDEDPEWAAALANLWAAETISSLAKAHQHAVEAQALQGYLVFLQACLQPPTEESPSPEACRALDPASLLEEIRNISAELESALALSEGVFPALIFDLSAEAAPPSAPVQYGRNSLVLAGGLIGFIIGILVVQTDLPRHLQRILQRG